MGTAVLLTLLAIASVSTVYIFNSVFERRGQEPFALEMRYTAEDGSEHPRREISFTSGEHTLSGYIYGEDNEKGLIVVIGGFHAEENAHLGEVFFFVDEGYRVLTFTPTGVGKSEGDSLKGLEQTRLDALAALDYLDGRADMKAMPVFLYGHSAGGYAAACLCRDERVSAAVSISGFNSPTETMRHFAAKYAGVLAAADYPVMKLYDRILFGKNGGLRASELLEGAECPVLIIHSSEDVTIPIELSIFNAVRDTGNPNIRTLLVDEPFKNRHSTVWLNADSAKRLSEYESCREEALHGTADELPSELEDILSANAEASNILLRDVDEALLNELCEFFLSSQKVKEK